MLGSSIQAPQSPVFSSERFSSNFCVRISQICNFITYCSAKFVYVYVKQFQHFVKYFFLIFSTQLDINEKLPYLLPEKAVSTLKFLFNSRLPVSCLICILNNIFAAFLIFAPYLNAPVVRGLAKLREKQQCGGKNTQGSIW